MPLPAVQIRPMREADLDAVLEIEQMAYRFPWGEGIFKTCMRAAANCCCWVMSYNQPIVAYSIMSLYVDKAHILNLCVTPDYQSRGLGRRMLAHLLDVAHGLNLRQVFLEVRSSNFRAISMYMNAGFNKLGIYKDYYPTELGREDAWCLAIEQH